MSASLLTLSIAACGNGNAGTGNSAGGASGKITVQFQKLETESTVGGALNYCHMTVTAKNRLGHEAKGVSFEFEPLVDDDMDAITAKASGVQTVYIGTVDTGETKEDTSKPRGFRCESLTAIKVLAMRCNKSGGAGSCADQLVLDGNGVVEIQQ